MNTIGGYFLKSMEDAVSLKANRVVGKNYRFTVLTDRLIRLEYNSDGVFLDEPTQRVLFRNFPKVKFQVVQNDISLQIITSYFTLDYIKEKDFTSGKMSAGGSLKINLNQTDRVWHYGHPEVRNFGGITYSLDDYAGNLKFEKGLYSTDGFACLDDSDSLVLDENGNFIVRGNKGIDIYVFMYRKDLGLCLQDYYNLTGYPMLIPRYALGTWWYKNTKYSAEELGKLLNYFKEDSIPLASVMLGDKWHKNGDPFVFDDDVLSSVKIKELANSYKVKFGVSVDPNERIQIDSLSGQNMVANGWNVDQNGYSFLPLSIQSLNFYSMYGIRNLINNGVTSFNINYSNLKNKGVSALVSHYCYVTNVFTSNNRNIVFSRNHNFATHRNTVVFTGRTKVDWNTLEILPRYNATASNSGISYVANAIGGYYGGIENFELYIRYIQFGVFSTMLVLASDDGKYYRREPWRWNEADKGIIKKYLKLRNSLIPYLYTESYAYHKTGSPIVQPLYYKYPKIYDEPLYKNQYFFGTQMLVCPITKKKNTVMNRVVQRMFIPEGIWYEFESGKKYVGNKYYMSFYRDEDYPVFCKEGAIIPLSLDDDVENPRNMEIVIFPGSDGCYKLYEDDGISNDYINGNYSITEMQFFYKKNGYEFCINNTNSNFGIVPEVRNYKIRFKNTKLAKVNIVASDNSFKSNYYTEKNDFIVEVSNLSTSGEVKISCYGEDSIEKSTISLINDDIKGILEDLEIETTLKEKIDAILFGELTIKKKRIAIRKLKRVNLEPKFIKMFLNLLEYIDSV